MRRPAAQARAHIMRIAREQVLSVGPSALRLKEVAAAAGVSHPTVLHHFGSREGLVAAVVDDAMLQMDDELEAILAASTELEPAPILSAVAEVMSDRGYGRLLAWLALSSEQGAIPGGRVATIIDAVHTTRLRLHPDGVAPPSAADSAFLSMLVTYALVGEAILGQGMRENVGPERVGGREDFRARLIALVRGWVQSGTDQTSYVVESASPAAKPRS